MDSGWDKTNYKVTLKQRHKKSYEKKLILSKTQSRNIWYVVNDAGEGAQSTVKRLGFNCYVIWQNIMVENQKK